VWIQVPRNAPSWLSEKGRDFRVSGDLSSLETATYSLHKTDIENEAEAEAIRAAVELADGRRRPARPLYVGLMAAIGPHGVRDRVRGVYAGVVADDLRQEPFTGALVARLAEGTVDPQVVIDRYGLREGAFLEELRGRLRRAAGGDAAISRALAFLLDPALGQHAWAWLTGRPASQLLAEHGVPGSLGTDAQALKALGAVACLYGQAGPQPQGEEPGIGA